MGHQMACLYMLQAMAAEAVCVVPTFAHAFAKSLSPMAQRMRLCQAMVAPFAQQAFVSDIEAQLSGISRSYATLQALKKCYPQRRWAIAVGSDLWAQLPRWHDAQALFSGTPVALLGRQNAVDAPPCAVQLPDISSRQIRARLQAGQSIAGLVPVAIAADIAAASLYASPQP